MLLDKKHQHDFQSITVTEGDTLWEIASSYQNSRETHEVINLIKIENNITDDIIQAGQILRVPVFQVTEKEIVYATSEERR
ncbi:LysM peptidoglycan-binding domain-containing protein [Mangrovibacillus cuniculi]|uniref:LysM peptidoglycan-binding domain-containing protein n=2 Tax=Mangrovibacillus cuniculi TaxID=2593652 RepID=A0A7S8CAJ6_9BACI|nr:LysM peptidoglycan-binding domain-containing protein [Mangrovibacillus cuniculi]QPC46439.1 LysM peptidoglycan-binding domain-containing protein [Mangrovibacillus cuniculi]